MKHKVERFDNLMYNGCEPHWHCIHCDGYWPFHCYTNIQLEKMDCEGKSSDSELMEACKKYLALPPFDTNFNGCAHDDLYYKCIEKKYGKKAVKIMCKTLIETAQIKDFLEN